jgi:hypothetical protein
MERPSRYNSGTPGPTEGRGPLIPGSQPLDVGDGVGLVDGAKLNERAHHRLEQARGRFTSLAEVTGPLGEKSEVQLIQRRELGDDCRVRSMDNAALDLRQVRVRDAGAPLNITEREFVVQAGPPKDVTQDWLCWLGALIVSLPASRRIHIGRIATQSAITFLANQLRNYAKMIRR